MAQKDKVKELVGRGLDSYHTKSLQQMDRIEKKNKEQNHKISILSNELDNDYLTKTEEGSVISLEHSKEGMVYLDELQGNTLVNYCTDGSKELTLNGDIDVEGTNVTLTEGVDNGLVDVMCEGNTLVNLNKRFNSTQTSSWDATNSDYVVSVEGHTVAGGVLWYYTYLKPSTTYTMVVNILECANMKTISLDSHYSYPPTNTITLKKEVGVQKIVFSTKDSFEQVGTSIKIATYGKDTTNKLKISKHMLLLEGDWTNKEIPQYFEGMKSVGECEDNKIEILSQNKNLVSGLEVGGLYPDSGLENPNNGTFTIRNKGYIKVEPNTTYILSIENDNTFEGMVFHIYDINKKQIEYNPSSKFTLTTPNNAYYLRFRSFNSDANNVNTNLKIQLEKGNIKTSYVPHSINKKEILMNEPLRGLPNGIKDKKVKICNKWYIERNCGEVTITEDALTTKSWGDDGNKRYVYVGGALPNMKTDSYIYTDKIPYTSSYTSSNYFGTRSTSILIFCFPEQIETIEEKKELVRPYLQNGGLKVVYELETPIYEPLEIEPTLNTYNDITHISNNSIIPCNMKIKNSGYNAIIKPSTLYTLALDTNKSGTIGMNLGGVKGTTTNNVLKLTTPATLTDDSLRLYGKGIKGSKVRLLEGDKTNWIPSHFEGMKSSFEDKFDATDNTYKMEILSNNKNVLNLDDIVMKGIGTGCKLDACSTDLIQYTSNQAEWTQIFFMMKLKPFTRYTLSVELQSMNVYVFNDRVGNWDANKYIGGMQNTTNTLKKHQYSFTTNKNGCISIRFTNERMLGVNIAKNIILSEVVGEYIPKKSNKIQFSSIEPLRGVNLRNGSYKKDRFVFIDNSLKIERNCKKIILDGSQDMVYNTNEDKNGTAMFSTRDITEKRPSYHVECDTFSSAGNNLMTTTNFADKEGIGAWSALVGFNIRIKTCKLNSVNVEGIKEYLRNNPATIIYPLSEPTYEEVPFELQKIILEGYENGTLFFDTNIPPTSTVIYAGETPIVKSVKLNKTEVLNNTNDINDNIIPYLMDMDYRVVCLQLQSEEFNGGVAMARLFGGAYEMLQRDIQSKRYSVDEYRYRLDAYLSANKITEEEYNKLGDMLNE